MGLGSGSFAAPPPKRIVGAADEAAPNMPGPGVDPALAVENIPPALCGVDVFLSVGWSVDAVGNIDDMSFVASPVGVAGLSPVVVEALCEAGPPKVNPEDDDIEGAVGSLPNEPAPKGAVPPVAFPLPDMAPLVGVDAELLGAPKGNPVDVPLPNKPGDGVVDVPAAGAPRVLPKIPGD